MFWLKHQIKKIRRETTPSRAFEDALLRRIAGAPVSRPVFRFVGVGAAAIILFFSLGTGVYAYGSPDVLDGHPLYFIKQGLERAEGRFATTAETRARFHARMTERRMEEAERIAENQDRLVGALESAAMEMDLSIGEMRAEFRDPRMRKEVVDRLVNQNDRYERVFLRVQARDEFNRPLSSPESIRERINSLSR